MFNKVQMKNGLFLKGHIAQPGEQVLSKEKVSFYSTDSITEYHKTIKVNWQTRLNPPNLHAFGLLVFLRTKVEICGFNFVKLLAVLMMWPK